MVYDLGKLLIGTGVAIAGVGLLLMLVSRLPGGGLPGDIVIQRKHFTFVFPLATCVVISVVLTLIFHFFGKR